MLPKFSLKMVIVSATAIAAVLAAYTALDQVGLRPVVNSEVAASEVRVGQQIAGLEKFSRGTRFLVLQNDRRYWQGELDKAKKARERDPDNEVIEARIRDITETLSEIQRQLEEPER